MSINSVTGLVQWTPLARQVGSQDVEIIVEDGQGSKATQTFRIEVVAAPINRPPVITTKPVLIAAVGQPYTYDVDASDADGNSLNYEPVIVPVGMSINPQSAQSLDTQCIPTGNQPVLLAVNDGLSLALQRFMVDVEATNRPPVINSLPLQTVIPGQDYRYDVMATDPDGIH